VGWIHAPEDGIVYRLHWPRRWSLGLMKRVGWVRWLAEDRFIKADLHDIWVLVDLSRLKRTEHARDPQRQKKLLIHVLAVKR
jgi:hypothetical protein